MAGDNELPPKRALLKRHNGLRLAFSQQGQLFLPWGDSECLHLSLLVPPGFVWVPPEIRASPNFRATAQAGAATAAPCDSCDGDPQETQKDFWEGGADRRASPAVAFGSAVNAIPFH